MDMIRHDDKTGARCLMRNQAFLQHLDHNVSRFAGIEKATSLVQSKRSGSECARRDRGLGVLTCAWFFGRNSLDVRAVMFQRPPVRAEGSARTRTTSCPGHQIYFFASKSRISVSNFSSALGAGGSAGFSASLRLKVLIAFTARNITAATMRKFSEAWRKLP